MLSVPWGETGGRAGNKIAPAGGHRYDCKHLFIFMEGKEPPTEEQDAAKMLKFEEQDHALNELSQQLDDLSHGAWNMEDALRQKWIDLTKRIYGDVAFTRTAKDIKSEVARAAAMRAWRRAAPGRPGSRPASQASSRSRPASFLGLQTGKVSLTSSIADPKVCCGCSTTRPSPLSISRATGNTSRRETLLRTRRPIFS